MSKTETKNSYADFDWLERAISEDYIKYYDFGEFTNLEEISSGSYVNVSCAKWKGSETIMALKHSFNLTIKEIVNEIKIQREVDYHANIIKFYGISKSNLTNNYLLVMEYADGGSLQSYLKENFNKLEWSNKYQLALQLANAVACIHNEGIIHNDLHAQNVLVHQNNIKLADFGLSRKITDASSYSTDVFGVSDVYSVGILLWQVSSGHKPFYAEHVEYDANLIMKIGEGMREKIVLDTPIEYSNLYEACWKDNPNERPTMQQVVNSSESNYPIAQVYVASCYKAGFGTEINYNLAFKWMQKAVENKSIYGQINLSNYYENSIGTNENLDKAFNLYNEAANNGNLCGLFNMGRCYELGIGIKKNESKAFEIYRNFHEKEFINGKYKLGICYYFGIGTEINKKKAFEIYFEGASD
ncbi:19845_t:CDS:2 [Funneliformis geosporum]|nr:19845_t:CDS:2 [Funneliformis geosporum]